MSIIILLAGCGWFLLFRNEPAKPSAQSSGNQKKDEIPFDKSQFSLDEAASIWVVVNKRRPLNPETYKPATLVVPNVKLQDSPTSEEMKLRPEAAQALEKLVASAKQEAGHSLMLASGYRGYIFQKNLYDRYVRTEGQASADLQSARPGHSEHQTGLAADVASAEGVTDCVVDTCFADTPEGKWVAKNAHRFGFTLRYDKEKTAITGYQFEPWHLRYVGDALASELQSRGTTLEEFFGLDAAPDYGN